jgi:short-subunit dehydrogenase
MTRKNILITGASAGLGMGMAREFAARGRNLVLCARRAHRLADLSAELKSANPAIRIMCCSLDVTDHAEVFRVFREARAELGSIDRVIVNAGRSKGHPLGTGEFANNVNLVETNFVAALAQFEAAMEIFRDQGSGHLVVMSSFAALRGFPAGLSSYSAGKSGVAVLAEGLRFEMAGSPIAVTAIFPGYIRSDMNAARRNAPFIVDNERGCRMLVKAIEREPAKAFVPSWPWRPLGFVMRLLPDSLTMRLQAWIYRSASRQ